MPANMAHCLLDGPTDPALLKRIGIVAVKIYHFTHHLGQLSHFNRQACAFTGGNQGQRCCDLTLFIGVKFADKFVRQIHIVFTNSAERFTRPAGIRLPDDADMPHFIDVQQHLPTPAGDDQYTCMRKSTIKPPKIPAKMKE